MDIFSYDPDTSLKPPAKYYDRETGEMFSASQALMNARYRLVFDGVGWRASELMVCNHPIFNPRHYGLLGTPSKRRPPLDPEDMTDDQIADSRDRSRRRALKAMKDIMDCNRFDWFVTFTLDGKKIDRSSYEAFVKAVGTYMKNRVQRFGWKYLAVPEYHADQTSLHLHALISGDLKTVDSGTVLRPDRAHGKRPVKRATALKQGYRLEDCKTVYNVTDWTLGFSTAIRTYGRPDDLRRYVGKYITKSDDMIGGRWYYSGGDLIRPRYLCTNVDFAGVTDAFEFSNPGGDFKIIYMDRDTKSDKSD